MSLEFDIFLPGDYFFDLIYAGLPEFPSLGREVYSTDVTTTGGAMFITAVSLQRLGVRVGWPVCFGNDYYSQSVRQFAIDEGIDLALAECVDVPYRRITTSIPYQGERAFVTYTDPAPIDIEALWLKRLHACKFKHLHLGGFTSIELLKPFAEAAQALGATVSMDCQDMPNFSACEWRHLLKLVDIFMPNAREAMCITNTESAEDALKCLMEIANLVVLKHGSHGALIGKDGDIIRVPSIKVGPVIDTTGAGDCFNAGFLYGYVVQHASLETCGRYGNICGGLSVTMMGGASAAPRPEQLMQQYDLNYE
ncbi:MAG TPA: PfkB family carbohydrate kinase [Aggregatilineaceae bacterium]|nr:PfkB family carbohydrate kinase [Aggregatilineaceae bacterium]